jgi:hypothetical protein
LALVGKEVERRADSQFALAAVLWKQGDHARARTLAENAAQIYRDNKQPHQVEEIEGWLAAHR